MGGAAESYEELCAAWRSRQTVVMQQLQHALDAQLQEQDLQPLVAMAQQLFSFYFDATNDAATIHDVLQAITPPCITPLEKAFLWLGGWRPSAAYVLVYALAGHKVQEELSFLLAGIDTPSLASLSAAQLSQISEMQVFTLKEEQLLQHHKALLQQSITAQPILRLAQAIKKRKAVEECDDRCDDQKPPTDDQGGGHADHPKEAMTGRDLELQHRRPTERFNRRPARIDNVDDVVQIRDKQQSSSSSLQYAAKRGKEGKESEGHYGTIEELFKCVMREKLKRLEELFLRADSLRRRTLAGLLEVLQTVQCVQFLLAALQLQLAVRDVGEKMKQNL